MGWMKQYQWVRVNRTTTGKFRFPNTTPHIQLNLCCWEILALSHMIACGDDPHDITKSVLISDVIIKVGNSIMRDSQQSTQTCRVMHAVNIQWAIKENGTENI